MELKRITQDKAEGLVKVINNLDDAKYFTLTPDIDPQKASEGWESVTYYSDRRASYQLPTNVPNAQWVYVLSNPSMPGLVKIGYTNNDPDTRIKEINRATGIPTDFIVEFAFPCVNGYEVEQLIHQELDDLRVNNRKEFFRVSVEDAMYLIQEIGEDYEIKE